MLLSVKLLSDTYEDATVLFPLLGAIYVCKIKLLPMLPFLICIICFIGCLFPLFRGRAFSTFQMSKLCCQVFVSVSFCCAILVSCFFIFTRDDIHINNLKFKKELGDVINMGDEL